MSNLFTSDFKNNNKSVNDLFKDISIDKSKDKMEVPMTKI
jgi:hypothetical protein